MSVLCVASPDHSRSASTMPSAPHGIAIVASLVALGFDAAFLLLYVLNPVDFCLSSREAIDYVDLSFVWVRMVSALLTTALAFCSCSFLLRPVVAPRLQLKTAPAHCCPAFRLTPLSPYPGSDPRRRSVTSAAPSAR